MRLDEFTYENQSLYEEWRSSYASDEIDFIYDGATDPERWLQSEGRILCILKEAHGGGEWNHAEAIRKHDGLLRVGGSANQATHYRMVEWLLAIEASLFKQSCDIEKDRLAGYPQAKQAMLRSAWINIKKANGVAQSDSNDLNRVVIRDGVFLQKQLTLLAPRFVLCCGTFGLIQDLLFPESKRIPETEFSHRCNNTIIMDYRHPARASRDSYKPLAAEAERIRQIVQSSSSPL